MCAPECGHWKDTDDSGSDPLDSRLSPPESNCAESNQGSHPDHETGRLGNRRAGGEKRRAADRERTVPLDQLKVIGRVRLLNRMIVAAASRGPKPGRRK